MAETVAPIAQWLLGLFAGSLLTEAVILVSYWRKMDPRKFQALHSEMGPSLYRYFAPLTLAAVGATVLAAILAGTSSPSWITAAILSLIAFLTFPLYFKRANARFAAGGLSDDRLAKELRHWEIWHWSRTIMILVAFGLALI